MLEFRTTDEGIHYQVFREGAQVARLDLGQPLFSRGGDGGPEIEIQGRIYQLCPPELLPFPWVSSLREVDEILATAHRRTVWRPTYDVTVGDHRYTLRRPDSGGPHFVLYRQDVDVGMVARRGGLFSHGGLDVDIREELPLSVVVFIAWLPIHILQRG